ncbi:MAG: hypothetical protein U0103_10820 [Candidatus Obscuribacterales bacterium]
MSGVINEHDLERLLKLHAIYQGCKIPVQVVLDAYKFSITEGLTVEQALAKAGVIAQVVSYSRLGTILVDSKLITKAQLDECQKLAYETKLPLGKMLTMHGVISDDQLMLALELQRRMRDRSITKDEALTALGSTKNGSNTRAIFKAERGPVQPVMQTTHSAAFTASAASASSSASSISQISGGVSAVNISELFLVSGVLTEQDAQRALDLSFDSVKSLEEIFIDSGLVSESLLNVALELQEAVNCGDLCLEAASETLAYIVEYDIASETI